MLFKLGNWEQSSGEKREMLKFWENVEKKIFGLEPPKGPRQHCSFQTCYELRDLLYPGMGKINFYFFARSKRSLLNKIHHYPLAPHPSHLVILLEYFLPENHMDSTAVITNFQLRKAEQDIDLASGGQHQIGGIVFICDTCKWSRKGQADAHQDCGGKVNTHISRCSMWSKRFFLYLLLPVCSVLWVLHGKEIPTFNQRKYGNLKIQGWASSRLKEKVSSVLEVKGLL